jgi:hypothetical protein
MTERSVKCGMDKCGMDKRGMDKRKVCVFLILVGIAVACLCVLMYTLFYAMPHSNTPLKKGGHSMVRDDAPRLPCRFVPASSARS